MRTIETKVYRFDELSDRAKEHARDWYRQGSDGDNYWSESVIEDCATIADIIGINLRSRTVQLMGGGTRQDPEIYWEGFSHQGQGASYVGSYAYKRGSVQALESHAPSGTAEGHERNNEVNRIARDLQVIQRRNFYQLQASIRASRGHRLDIEVDRLDGNPLTADAEDVLVECLWNCAHWIYRCLRDEYEYQNADEQVDENIRANEYEFDEEGNRA